MEINDAKTVADTVFQALANSTRREILRVLRDEGEQPVQRLAEHFAMRRPSVSEHLMVLRAAGLVDEQKRGRQRFYHLEPAPFAHLREWLAPYERFWTDRLASLDAFLATEDEENERE